MKLDTQTIQTAVFPIAVLSLVTAFAALPVTAHIPLDSGDKRVFFADDPDPLRSKNPLLESVDLRWLEANDDSIQELALSYDFYYFSTNPEFRTESDRISLVDFQRRQLAKIDTSTSTSRWLLTEAGPDDGRYIKDAVVAIVEVERGATLRVLGTAADGQYLVPADGAVFTHMDFRIDERELPENYCTSIDWDYKDETYIVEVPRYDEDGSKYYVEEERTRRVKIDGDQWCYSYRLEGLTVNRTLQIGAQNFGVWSGSSAGPKILAYSNAQASDIVELAVTAEIGIVEVETERHRDWDRGSGWDIESKEETEQSFREQVTDSKPVLITTNQDLTVHQRIIEISDTHKGIVLEFEGPPSLAERRLWSRVIFSDQQEVANVWGVYSVQRTHRGKITSNRNPSPRNHHFPTFLQLGITSRAPMPLPRFESDRELGYYVIPEIIAYDRQQLGTDAFDLPSRVNLSTSPVYRYDAIVVKNAPSAVREVLDVHGDPVPLETETYPYKEAKILVDLVDDHRTEVRLVSDEDQRGLADRLIYLSGAGQENVRTNDHGVAIVRPTSRYVTAEFRGDDWREDRTVFYGPARATVPVRFVAADLMVAIGDLAQQWRIVGFWIVLAILGWLWYRSR